MRRIALWFCVALSLLLLSGYSLVRAYESALVLSDAATGEAPSLLVAEWFDRALLELTGVISGHTLKHLIAALAVYWRLRMLHLRRPASLTETPP